MALRGRCRGRAVSDAVRQTARSSSRTTAPRARCPSTSRGPAIAASGLDASTSSRRAMAPGPTSVSGFSTSTNPAVEAANADVVGAREAEVRPGIDDPDGGPCRFDCACRCRQARRCRRQSSRNPVEEVSAPANRGTRRSARLELYVTMTIESLGVVTFDLSLRPLRLHHHL